MNIRIMTDSAADFAEKDTAAGLTILPMTITFGQEEYKDGVTLSHKEFYERLIESDELPTTSQIAPYDFRQAFKEVQAAGETAILITLSGKLSGSWQNAVLAAQEFDNIYVVDSENAALGEGILVSYALRLRDQGLEAADIVQILENDKKNICLVALLDTLEYLKKGGRISKAVAFAGGLLSIKPVISLIDGEVAILGKARGSKQGNNMLIEQMKACGGVDFEKPILLGYTGLSDILIQKYKKDSEALWVSQAEDLSIVSVGGTIGTHAGPGAVAVAFFHR